MLPATWSAYARFDEVVRQAGGRRQYNSLRAPRARERRLRVLQLLDRWHGSGRGVVRLPAASRQDSG